MVREGLFEKVDCAFTWHLAKQGMIYAASVLGCTDIDILEHPEKNTRGKKRK